MKYDVRFSFKIVVIITRSCLLASGINSYANRYKLVFFKLDQSIGILGQLAQIKLGQVNREAEPNNNARRSKCRVQVAVGENRKKTKKK